MRDRIAVEREYEEERCGTDCHRIYRPDGKVRCYFYPGQDIVDNKRLPSCLATPGLPEPKNNKMENHMDEIGTLINHIATPHCCGCYTIRYGNSEVGLRAVCNECGHTVDLLTVLSTPALPEPQDAEVREAIKTVSGVFAEIQHDIDRTNAMTDRPIEAIYVHVSGVDALVAGFRTLLRAVQSPRLTGERLEAELDALTDDERQKLFSSYCTHCGTKDPGCRCWDDD